MKKENVKIINVVEIIKNNKESIELNLNSGDEFHGFKTMTFYLKNECSPEVKILDDSIKLINQWLDAFLINYQKIKLNKYSENYIIKIL